MAVLAVGWYLLLPGSTVAKVPLISTRGLEEYRRFLAAPIPKAFAVAPSQTAWAWNLDDEDKP
jgi:hypothetical protein